MYCELFKAIRRHSGLGWREIAEAGIHGADAGWSGFTYTVDGARFYRENYRLVDDLLGETADSMGCANVAELLAGFTRADMTETRDGRDCLCAWFALEEVGRWIQSQRDDRPIYGGAE